MMTLGYDYIMSKRTKMYFVYNKIDNGSARTTTTLLAGRERTGTGSEQAPAPNGVLLRLDGRP